MVPRGYKRAGKRDGITGAGTAGVDSSPAARDVLPRKHRVTPQDETRPAHLDLLPRPDSPLGAHEKAVHPRGDNRGRQAPCFGVPPVSLLESEESGAAGLGHSAWGPWQTILFRPCIHVLYKFYSPTRGTPNLGRPWKSHNGGVGSLPPHVISPWFIKGKGKAARNRTTIVQGERIEPLKRNSSVEVLNQN